MDRLVGEVRALSSRSTKRAKIVWARSATSLTSEVGWVGQVKMFSLIHRGTEMALHIRLPGRDGIQRPSIVRACYRDEDETRSGLHAEADRALEEFLADINGPLADEAKEMKGAALQRPVAPW